MAEGTEMKFHNIKTKGYDSRKEYRRAEELKMYQKVGAISRLEFQKRFQVIPKQDGERASHYIADFVYYECDGTYVVEDAKGFKTPDYILKRKLMLLVHGIRIKES